MKNYLCKDCINNNHGWCPIQNRNKLKEITVCSYKDNGEDPFAKTENSDDSIVPFNNESIRITGKREMLHNIQRQIFAMEKEYSGNTLNEIKKVLVSLSDMLGVEESVHGVTYSSEIDKDIKITSNQISNHWRNQKC